MKQIVIFNLLSISSMNLKAIFISKSNYNPSLTLNLMFKRVKSNVLCFSNRTRSMKSTPNIK